MRKPVRASIRGNSLVTILILLAVVGGGFFLLNGHKQAMEREAHAYAAETVERLLFAHDQTYLGKNLSSAAALDFPPARQEIWVKKLIEAGAPARPVNCEGNVNFESHFFNPSAALHAHLLFAGGPGDLALNISHPGGRWQIDAISIDWNFSGVR